MQFAESNDELCKVKGALKHYLKVTNRRKCRLKLMTVYDHSKKRVAITQIWSQVVKLKLDFLHNQPQFCQNRFFTGYWNAIITKSTIINLAQA